jgi:anaerobic ribonucleoside-triphosphate reductase activating protein
MELTINPFKINLLNTYEETIADGEGIRYSIYLAGCRHACEGCHNRASWNPKAGILFTDEILQNIIDSINNNPLLDGITLSGGDPFFNPAALLVLLKILKKETNQNIWCYTGYRYEELLEDETMKDCLNYIDTLVDGRFEISQFDPRLLFRGSRNQRIIHLQPNSFEIKRVFQEKE